MSFTVFVYYVCMWVSLCLRVYVNIYLYVCLWVWLCVKEVCLRCVYVYSNGQNKREFFSIFLLIELFLKHVSIVYQTKQQTLFFTNPKTEWLNNSSYWFYGSSTVAFKKRASQKMLRLGNRCFLKNGPIESVRKAVIKTEKGLFSQGMIFN